jgi:type II restriction enzyme
MELKLNPAVALGYSSAAQKARVLTESWVKHQSYCPNCGHFQLEQYENSRRVADFFCSNCHEDFELKSKKTAITGRIVDGAFSAMTERLLSSTNPNLFLMNYDAVNLAVNDFFIVPKYFFTPEIIEKRKALSPSARRAGWVGCNILLEGIPQSGRIYLVKDRIIEPPETVLSEWQKTVFLREETDIKSRGWLLDVMACLDTIGARDFDLNKVYQFEQLLGQKHPDNKHIKDKIRQQLQVLRDRGYLEFTGRGHYRLT